MTGTTAQMPAQLEAGHKEPSVASSEVTSNSVIQQQPSRMNFTWEKLSPSEFQQLQDFAACEYD